VLLSGEAWDVSDANLFGADVIVAAHKNTGHFPSCVPVVWWPNAATSFAERSVTTFRELGEGGRRSVVGAPKKKLAAYMYSRCDRPEREEFFRVLSEKVSASALFASERPVESEERRSALFASEERQNPRCRCRSPSPVCSCLRVCARPALPECAARIRHTTPKWTLLTHASLAGGPDRRAGRRSRRVRRVRRRRAARKEAGALRSELARRGRQSVQGLRVRRELRERQGGWVFQREDR